MDDLVNVISDRAGITEEQARQAVDAVLDVLRERLPGPVATQVEKALKNPDLAKGASDLLDKGKGLFGG